VKPARSTNLLLILAVIIAAYSSISLAGESYYRWDDKWGNPVHSDRPPPKGVDYEVVSSGTSLVRRVNSAEGVVPAKIEPTIDNNFEQVETKPDPVKKNPEICDRAQENLTTLNTYARIRLRDDQGEYRYITEEEKEAQRDEARNLISVHCD
jgi:hypothetical protein